MSPIDEVDRGASGLPATLRELLHIAETELDTLAVALGRGSGPDPLLVAREWPTLRRAGAHLLDSLNELSVRGGGASKVTTATAHAARALRDLEDARPARRGSTVQSTAGDSAPVVSDHLPDSAAGAIARAADLLGAAGDMARSVHGGDLARADIVAASLACSALVTKAGQVTTHATIHDLRTLRTAQEASAAAAITAEVLSVERQGDGRFGLDMIGVRSRPEPRPGDVIRSLEVAIWDWRVAALQAAERAAPSSRDLRVALAGASQLLGVGALALQAVSQLHRRDLSTSHHPDADQLRISVQRTDGELARKLRTAMVDCTAAAAVWNGHSTGTPGTPELLSATAAVTTAVSLTVRDGGRWLTPGELIERGDPLALALATRSAVDAVRDVLRAHHDVVEHLLRQGQVYLAARTLPPVTARPDFEDLPTRVQDELAFERMKQVRDRAWLPVAWGEDSGPLTDAYASLPGLASRVRAGYWSATSHLEDPTRRSVVGAAAERDARTRVVENPDSGTAQSGPTPTAPTPSVALARPIEISRSELRRRVSEYKAQPDADRPKNRDLPPPTPRPGRSR